MSMRETKTFRTTNNALVLAVVMVGALTVGLPESRANSVYGSGLFELGNGALPLVAGQARIVADPMRLEPDWSELFGADGSARDEYDESGNPVGNGVPEFQEFYGGRWAVFISDDVSLGLDPDSTALHPLGGVYSATVDADHDIEKVYVYATTDAAGNLVLYAGAERLADGDSELHFEFNQDHFRLGHGGYGANAPWKIDGTRFTGDLLVSLVFFGGALDSTEVKVWLEDGESSGWQPLQTVVGESCDVEGTACVVGNGAEIAGGPWGAEVVAQGRFVELGVNVGALFGGLDDAFDYTTIQLRTPQDAAFGYFAEGN